VKGKRACYKLRCTDAPRPKKLWKENAQVPKEKVEWDAMRNEQEVSILET